MKVQVEGREVFAATNGGTEFDPDPKRLVVCTGGLRDRTAWRGRRWFATWPAAVLASVFPPTGRWRQTGRHVVSAWPTGRRNSSPRWSQKARRWSVIRWRAGGPRIAPPRHATRAGIGAVPRCAVRDAGASRDDIRVGTSPPNAEGPGVTDLLGLGNARTRAGMVSPGLWRGASPLRCRGHKPDVAPRRSGGLSTLPRCAGASGRSEEPDGRPVADGT